MYKFINYDESGNTLNTQYPWYTEFEDAALTIPLGDAAPAAAGTFSSGEDLTTETFEGYESSLQGSKIVPSGWSKAEYMTAALLVVAVITLFVYLYKK